jgi:type II secretion system protein C
MMLICGLIALAVATPPADLVLTGFISSHDGQAGAAIIRSSGKTRIANMGETAFGGRLTRIDEQGVELLFGEERVKLNLAKASGARPLPIHASTQPSSQSSTASEAAPPQPSFTLSRTDVDRRLSIELNRILAETALVPVTEDGRVVGVALRRIAEGSLLTEVGLRPGDVLKELNGTKIDGIATLMSLYSRLQSSKELKAVVQRDGQSVPISVSFR